MMHIIHFESWIQQTTVDKTVLGKNSQINS